MPFGMVNSGATLVLGLKKVLEELSGVGSYIGDIVVYNNSWEEHVAHNVAHNVARLAPQSELNLYISLICLNSSKTKADSLYTLGH